jgi:hypothetical protein
VREVKIKGETVLEYHHRVVVAQWVGERRSPRRAELGGVIARIPPRAKVVAAETLVPHVCDRPDAYTLRLGLFDAEYLLFAVPPTTRGELPRAAFALASGMFGVADTGALFVLARRGHATSANAAVLACMAPFLGEGSSASRQGERPPPGAPPSSP